MNYLGSKRRIVADILPVMLARLKPGQPFVDAFCGGAHVIGAVPPEYPRIANDNNRYLVALWKALTGGGWSPPLRIERDFYNDVRSSYHAHDGRYPDELIGWVGFIGSYNGRFFDGGYSGHNVKGRDYIAEAARNILAQVPTLKGVDWQAVSYDKMAVPEHSLIYCDPPYRGAKGYTTSGSFDYEHFYDWCRSMTAEGHTVYVSEYTMPPDFVCVWEKEIANNMNKGRAVERLFTLPSINARMP